MARSASSWRRRASGGDRGPARADPVAATTSRSRGARSAAASRRMSSPPGFRKLGAGRCLLAAAIAYSAMLTGRYDCDYVEIVGVVQRAWLSSDPPSRVMFADVAIEEGVVRASFWDYSSPADLTRFIDARVQLRGNIGTIFGQTEQLRGVSLFVGRTRGRHRPRAAAGSVLVAHSIRNIYNYSAAGEVNRRIRVRGVVTARIPGRPVEMNDFTTSSHVPLRPPRPVCQGRAPAARGSRPSRASQVQPGRSGRRRGLPGRHAGQADPDETPCSASSARGGARGAACGRRQTC